MTDQTQPWPRAQRMPIAIAGGRPQPWHQQGVAEYDAAHGTTTERNHTIPGGYTAQQINNAIRWWNERADGMSTPLIYVTLHAQFKRGDKVRLVHTDGREFVTDGTLAVERDSTSVTFASVPSRTVFEVIVDRVDSASCSVTLERSGPEQAVPEEPFDRLVRLTEAHLRMLKAGDSSAPLVDRLRRDDCMHDWSMPEPFSGHDDAIDCLECRLRVLDGYRPYYPKRAP